jgi:hypothetical protein
MRVDCIVHGAVYTDVYIHNTSIHHESIDHTHRAYRELDEGLECCKRDDVEVGRDRSCIGWEGKARKRELELALEVGGIQSQAGDSTGRVDTVRLNSPVQVKRLMANKENGSYICSMCKSKYNIL